MKIAFIGGGNIATALIGGLIKRGTAPTDLYAIDIQPDTRERLARQFGIHTAATVDTKLTDYDIIVLAVKPQTLNNVARTLAPHLATQLMISVAAGVRVADLSRWLGGYARIVRAMPNMPALIGMGITGLAALPGIDADDRQRAAHVLDAIGTTLWCDEELQLDAITAISGSGPAYVFYFIEALQEAGRRLGLSSEQSHALAIATFTGAAQLAAQADEPVSVLRERVTSQGGTTAAALASFEAQGIQEGIIRGALAAQARAREIGNEHSQPACPA